MPEPDSPGEILPFEIRAQPDDSTCGPTCLHALYRYHGDDVGFDEVQEGVSMLSGGGTLGVVLASDALARGYRARLVSWNLQVFDPTWFAGDVDLVAKLRARIAAKEDPKLRFAAGAYAEFLERGGQVEFRDLEPRLLRRFLKRGLPILTGLSATFLYQDRRERASDNEPDDVAGDPVGHFVVLTGYSKATREVHVSDPLYPNPMAESHTYPVKMERLIGAIYLGVLTYDANLVVLEKGR